MNYSNYQIAIFDHVKEAWGQLKSRRAGRGGEPRNLIVQATAGAGKTSTIVELCKFVPDARVEVVSFNARVAEDVRTRLPTNGTSVTLHAVGKRALEAYFGRRYNKRDQMRAGDGELASDKTARIVSKLKSDGKLSPYVNTAQVCKLLSRAKGVGLVPSGATIGLRDPIAAAGLTADTRDAWQDLIEEAQIGTKDAAGLVTAAREVLVVSLANSGAIIDFDDMLYVSVVLPDLAYPRRDIVAVDELQDLDPMQREMVRRMCEDALFVGVGDRMQSLYSFRGASPDSMDRIAHDLRCIELPLSISYRCPASHVRLAQQLTHLIEARPDAPEGVIDNLTYDGMFKRLSDGDAVICRKNAPLVAMAYDLMKRRIPFRLLGKDAGGAVVSTLRGAGRPDADEALNRLHAKLARMRDAHLRKDEEDDEKTLKLAEHVEVLACVEAMIAKGWLRDGPGGALEVAADRHPDLVILGIEAQPSAEPSTDRQRSALARVGVWRPELLSKPEAVKLQFALRQRRHAALSTADEPLTLPELRVVLGTQVAGSSYPAALARLAGSRLVAQARTLDRGAFSALVRRPVLHEALLASADMAPDHQPHPSRPPRHQAREPRPPEPRIYRLVTRRVEQPSRDARRADHEPT